MNTNNHPTIFQQFENANNEGRIVLLDELEFSPRNEKWALFFKVIQDRKEYDLVRIKALKILEIAEVPENEKQSFSDAIANIIQTDDDDDIRNYAVIAGRNFIHQSARLKTLIVQILMNSTEDINIRHNAYSAILHLPRQEKLQVLINLSNDAEFGRYVQKDKLS